MTHSSPATDEKTLHPPFLTGAAAWFRATRHDADFERPSDDIDIVVIKSTRPQEVGKKRT